MMGNSELGTCGWVCWGVGVVAGILAFWVSVGAVTWLPALLIAIAVGVFVALVLGRFVCGWSMAGQDDGHGSAPAQSVASGAAEAGAAGATAMAAGTSAMAEKTEEKADELADKAKEKMDERAAKAGDAADEAGEAVEDVAEEAGEAVADAADKAKEARAAAADKAADVAGDVAEDVTGTRPEALSAARGGQPDDLKQIKGIGPKLEKLCNELGFYHFDQIAGWTEDEIAWVDANLKGFKGRVSRDNWVEQAKTLAAGGETEFSQRVGKGEVY